MTTQTIPRRLGWLCIAVGLCASIGCSPSGPSGGGSYIPNYDFTWKESAGANTTYVFEPDAKGVRSGAFTSGSFERIGAAPSLITGTFSDRDLTIVIHRSAGNVNATGHFNTDDVIQLTISTAVPTTITLNRIR